MKTKENDLLKTLLISETKPKNHHRLYTMSFDQNSFNNLDLVAKKYNCTKSKLVRIALKHFIESNNLI